MRVIKFLTMCAVVLFGLTHASAQWPNTTHPSDGRFWMEAGAGVFDRVGGKLNLPLISNSVTNEVLFTSDNLTDMNTAIGPNLRIGSHFKNGIGWEASTAFGNWETSETFAGPNLASPFVDPLADPDSIGVDYDSRFFDLQFNFRRNVWPGLTILAGPRYFDMTENLGLRTSTIVAAPPLGTIDFQTLNSAEASNRAIGGTLGLEFNQPFTRNFYVQGHAKASGLANQARLDRSSQTTLDPVLADTIDKSSGMFIGQAGGRVYCELVPRTFATYLGYEATWVDGVATAPSQDFVVGGAEMKNSNTIFWHAITFGARFTY